MLRRITKSLIYGGFQFQFLVFSAKKTLPKMVNYAKFQAVTQIHHKYLQQLYN